MPLSDYNYEPCLSKFAIARRLSLLKLIKCTKSGLDKSNSEGKNKPNNCR